MHLDTDTALEHELAPPPAGELIKGTHGGDSLTGTWGPDTILGGGGDDVIAGNEGADIIHGGRGADTILVGDFESLHIYDGGGNRAFGGDGDDYIYGQLNSTMDGGQGHDGFYLDLSLGAEGSGGVVLDLRSLDGEGTASFGATTLAGFEYGLLIGTAAADEVTIGTTGIYVLAGDGDDRIVTDGSDAVHGRGSAHGDDGDDYLQGGAGDQVFLGDSGRDTVIGGGGADLLRGGGGGDLIITGLDGGGEVFGDGGDDLIQAHGADQLFGYGGADTFQFYGPASLGAVIRDLHNEDVIDLSHIDADKTMAGRQHFDIVDAFGGHAGEALLEAVGGDTYLRMDRDGDGVADASLAISGEHADFANIVTGAAAPFDGVHTDSTISGTSRDDTLDGSVGDDIIRGLGGDDVLSGGRGADDIGGDRGRDTLHGGAGDDLLHGERGPDKLAGGLGADVYSYASIGDSTAGLKGRDHIFFEHDGDRIDLSAIDADTATAGDQAFHLADHFSKQAGELTLTTTSTGQLVEGDVDGDGHADFSIAVVSGEALVTGDFVL